MDWKEESKNRGFLVRSRREGWARSKDWWDLCKALRMPNIEIFVGPVGSKYADISYNADSMTGDQWTPRLTESAQSELDDRIRSLIHVHGSKRCEGTSGGSRVFIRSVATEEAYRHAKWVLRLFGRPQSWNRVLNPYAPDDDRIPSQRWRDLVFDWADNLEAVK